MFAGVVGFCELWMVFKVFWLWPTLNISLKNRLLATAARLDPEGFGGSKGIENHQSSKS